MSGDDRAALWLAVVALGVYHGLNPAMGWPLALARGLETRRDAALLATLVPLGAGHLAAMAVALLPFVLLAWVIEWQRAIRLGAGALVLLFGLYRFAHRRHPRVLARVPPARIAWWSFLMATAHGAGLMLLPIALGLCAASSAAGELLRSGATALAVAAAHTLAMVASGLAIAWLVYRKLGLQFLRKSWFDLDAAWALCLVVAGAAGILAAARS
ncbi:MAG TPA: hypothetical protein VFZ28_17470 [Burkholderiaceae bacterium]|nr:hypothetical protein [Burkholderiaceae bacterium]